MKRIQTLGFSLVEIMVVIAVIMVLGIIAVPNMMRSRASANESLAIRASQSIANACNLYASDCDVYPQVLTYMANINPPYIDSRYVSSSYVNGYSYTYSRIDESSFELIAVARNAISGTRCFFVDETSVVRACNGYNCTPTQEDPPVG